MEESLILDLLDRLPRLIGNGLNSLYDLGREGHWKDVRSTSITMISLRECAENPSSPWLQVPAEWLIERQRKDGSWEEEVWDTSLCLTALSLSTHRSSEEKKAAENAQKWLLEKRNIQGNWHEEPWETALSLLALMKTGITIEKKIIQDGIRWLISLQDPQTGFLVNHHYTAYLVLVLRMSITSGLMSFEEVGKKLIQAQEQLCKELSMDGVWTSEAWSNGLALSALVPLDTSNGSNLVCIGKVIDWFEATYDREWAGSDTEDTSLSIHGLHDILQYVLSFCVASKFARVQSKITDSDSSIQSQILINPYTRKGRPPVSRAIFTFDGDALVIHGFKRRAKVASIFLVIITAVTTIITFGQQIWQAIKMIFYH